MRNTDIVVLAVVVLLGAVLAFFAWGPSLGTPKKTAETAGEPPREQPVSGSSAKQEAKIPRSGGKEAERWGEKAERAVPETPATTSPLEAKLTPPPAATVKPSPVFPTGDVIPIGMDKGKLQAVFGKPSMKTTAVDQGRLLETYVYLQKDRDAATFVLMRNGRVVAAHTTIY